MLRNTLTPIMKKLKRCGYRIVDTKRGLKILKIRSGDVSMKPNIFDVHDIFEMIMQRSMTNPQTSMTWDNPHIIEIGKVVTALDELYDMIPHEFKREFHIFSKKVLKDIKKKQYPYMKYKDIVMKLKKFS